MITLSFRRRDAMLHYYPGLFSLTNIACIFQMLIHTYEGQFFRHILFFKSRFIIKNITSQSCQKTRKVSRLTAVGSQVQRHTTNISALFELRLPEVVCTVLGMRGCVACRRQHAVDRTVRICIAVCGRLWRRNGPHPCVCTKTEKTLFVNYVIFN